MKISRLECVVLGLTAVFLAFSAGWLARGADAATPIRVETQQSLTEEERTVNLLQASATDEPEALQPSETVAQVQALQPGEKIDINTADVRELQRLPGIGEKRAMDIVADRTANGPFRIPEDLTRIKGIGEGLLEKLIEHITVGGEK